MILEDSFPRNSADRHAIDEAYFADERQCVTLLLDAITLTSDDHSAIAERASNLVEVVRARAGEMGGVHAFMQQYDLSSQEGIVLLCLAEALLRIPDASTADQLIKDKLSHADWQKYVGQSQSLFVNASTWGLMLTGKIMSVQEVEANDYGAILNQLMSRLSEPVVRAAMKEAMRIMGHQFVMGRTINEALQRSKAKENERYRYSFDMLGEAAMTEKDALHYFEVYYQAISAIAGIRQEGIDLYDAPGLSVKLSALHPRFEFSKRDRLNSQLIPRVKQLAMAAQEANIAMTIDGEEADRLDITLDVVESILTDPVFSTWKGLGVVVQAYQKRAPHVINWLEQLLRRTDRYITVRLVKGAYWDTEIKRSQEQGLNNYPVFTRKQHTDVSYIACARKLLAISSHVYPQFATHNAHTAATIIQMMPDNIRYEFQRLHGMGQALHDAILESDVATGCRVYAPVGNHKDLLPYLVRRLLENGANTSFVNRITDSKIAVQDIIADPVLKVRQSDVTAHPNIPLPQYIYGIERKNSAGINLSDNIALQQLKEQISRFSTDDWQAAPLIDGTHYDGDAVDVVNPASRQSIGRAVFATADQLKQAVDVAVEGFDAWQARPVTDRAQCLEKAADLFEQHTAGLASLIILEGGRCVADALSEVREAVDFCRYYAALARKQFASPQLLPGPTGESNELSLHGRGVFVCISPWNFPLAIFTGQIAAALVTGNSVVAKPASQTTLVGMQAIRLLLDAGIPASVLQYVPSSGSLIASLLREDQRIAGVAFTGSTVTANEINVNLAQRGGPIVPLIAETGGQNAMIVDSSALPEQVVTDVVKSAFNSAGQRCSALRVLFIQEDIASHVVELLKGAMAELSVGNPVFVSTDVGPLINEQAVLSIEQHVEYLNKIGKLIYRVPDTEACRHGYFFTPSTYHIESLSQLSREVFGPILHVITYKASELDSVLRDINNTSYGLTLGIHSRIEEKARYIQRRVRVGNVYINRNMIGASVGVQPFGGEGLSGTGPKAGGPHYLYRFATERVLTTNCAAIGGNASLLTLE